MYIQKLPSGSYRVKEMVNKQLYSFTLDHKPTQAEAREILAKKISAKTVSVNSSVEHACDVYIESKSNLLSPATIRGYKTIIRQVSPSFLARNMNLVTLQNFQSEVNRYSENHSPKSTKNFTGFLQSVFKFYGMDFANITLPQKEKKTDYIPSKEDIRKIFQHVEGTKYEVPIRLAAFGLRRSEICALESSDLSGRCLTINKAMVQNDANEWIIKKTKTTDSTRTIYIPEDLADKIREQGYVYEGNPEKIYCALSRAQKELGIPHFSLHKMRHFFASYMHDQGYSDKQIQEFGGWKTDLVMKSVYQHAMDMDRAKMDMCDSLGSLK